MSGKVFFSVSMSLDGFIAPGSVGELMGQQWMELQQWMFPLRFFREDLGVGVSVDEDGVPQLGRLEGGEEGRDNDIVRETFQRTGASVMGKRMFDAGEQLWPEDAPFHTPVFVVTHEKREPWDAAGWDHLLLRQRRHRDRADPSPRGRARPGRPHSRRRRGDRAVPERRPGERVHDRAVTRALWLRDPVVRGRGREPRSVGPGPRRVVAAGYPPDLLSPAAVAGPVGKDLAI